METQRQGAWVARLETFAHDACPQTTRRAKLRNLFEQVVVRVEKERYARGKLVHLESGVQRGLDISNSICQGESNLLNGGRAGLTNVITTDRDCVPVSRFARAKSESVGHQTQ